MKVAIVPVTREPGPPPASCDPLVWRRGAAGCSGSAGRGVVTQPPVVTAIDAIST